MSRRRHRILVALTDAQTKYVDACIGTGLFLSRPDAVRYAVTQLMLTRPELGPRPVTEERVAEPEHEQLESQCCTNSVLFCNDGPNCKLKGMLARAKKTGKKVEGRDMQIFGTAKGKKG